MEWLWGQERPKIKTVRNSARVTGHNSRIFVSDVVQSGKREVLDHDC